MAWPAWVISLIISAAFTVAAYLLTPKPKSPRTQARDLQSPTAEAGRPIPIVFGTKRVKGLNVLWYGDKGKRTYKVKA